MLARLRSFVRAAVNRSAFEREMDDEIRFHLERRADDLVRGGLPRDAAIRRARLDFGNPEAQKLPFDQHSLVAMVAPRAILAIHNTGIARLGSQAGGASMKAAAKVYEALGVPERLGFSQAAASNHCVFPNSQAADVNAFVQRFLLGDESVDTNIRKADILFSVDTTGSMGGEIDNMQSSLGTLVIPGIEAIIMDTAFGVSEFEDYPFNPFGSATCMGTPDRPFRLHQQVTNDSALVETGLDRLDMPLGCGGDLPESGFEALYQIAAGTGVTWPGGSVPAFAPDPGTPGGGTIGGVGFRTDAFPIVVHVTDDVSHTHTDYAGRGIVTPHSRDDAVTALTAIRARVIGIASQLRARPQLEDVAIATSAVIPPDAAGTCLTAVDGAPRRPVMLPDGTEGCPLVFDVRANGSGLSSTLVDAVGALVTAITLDTVSVRVVGDPNGFIRATIPRSAVPPPGGALPTVADLDGDSVFDSFVGVTPGTVVTFTIIAFNDTVPRTSIDQVFTVTLQVIGDGVTVLDEKPVVIIVPRAM